MNHYQEFQEINKITSLNEIKVTIVSVNFKKDLCIVINKDRTYYLLPIELLIVDMENDMCHINCFSKLKKWNGFENEKYVSRMKGMYYPIDYLENTKNYVVDVTDIVINLGESKAYKTIGENIYLTYYENL